MSEVAKAADVLSEVNLSDTCTPLGENKEDLPSASPKDVVITIGATIPTGFELTAADEVQEKLGSKSRISKGRGKIYFEIPVISLPKVHQLRSVDNLFVVVQEFRDYQFKETKEETLKDLEGLVKKLPWTNSLEVWKLNTSLKKRKTRRNKGSHQSHAKKKLEKNKNQEGNEELQKPAQNDFKSAEVQDPENANETVPSDDDEQSEPKEELTSNGENQNEAGDGKKHEMEAETLKFRVTCNRAGDNHNFKSDEAARDFGGAVQDFFQWKADMTNFDVEVLLNIHNNEVIVGIALTEESLHRRNITHFGPTTLRSTLAYGMLRLCDPQPADVIIDPMCGTGAIPIEGVTVWPNCYHIAGDNHSQAVKKTANNISSLLKQTESKESTSTGKPIDSIQWDSCNLPLRTGSVDVIVTDLPFGKRMGSKKKNWDLYPSSLMEMARICRPKTGRAVLLTEDRKCFAKALSKMGHLWQKSHTIWVNVGGLCAAVYLLKRTSEIIEQARSCW
ncbi:THUMP domain-containing protein 3 [Python bivittatus]|uniref:THUMP domain-containing protein 3 n=1 Tax=Python bivittatus TaxID=176946 RepID=A0A9F2R525_PYTBI|nr:THUMP domain-containing protein 3 [Python bivittatus]XP_025027718.1 THUMP domain-containing protein 3 [Python bivittatus]